MHNTVKPTRRSNVSHSISIAEIEWDIREEIAYLKLEHLCSNGKPYFNWSLVSTRLNHRLGYPVPTDRNGFKLVKQIFTDVACFYLPHPSSPSNYSFDYDKSSLHFFRTIRRLIFK